MDNYIHILTQPQANPKIQEKREIFDHYIIERKVQILTGEVERTEQETGHSQSEFDRSESVGGKELGVSCDRQLNDGVAKAQTDRGEVKVEDVPGLRAEQKKENGHDQEDDAHDKSDGEVELDQSLAIKELHEDRGNV